MGRWTAYAIVLTLLGGGLVLATRGGKNPDLAEHLQARPVRKAPTVAASEPVVLVATAEVIPAPVHSYGLTFALAAAPPGAAAEVAHLSCHGEPQQLDQPHQNSCNPYRGDMSCRTVLPLLCVRPTGAPPPQGVEQGFYNGWVGGALGATAPVMGAVLRSRAQASARCEAELGPGWRMAEFHDGQGGWGLQGLPGAGLLGPGQTRYWVAISDQRGNCWDDARPATR